MSNALQHPNVLLLAGDLQSNLGDRAIRASLVDILRDVCPNAMIYGFSRDPEKDKREFGIQIAGRSVLALFTSPLRMRKMDLVIWGGGQLLQDDTSLLKNIFWMVILTWVRRVLGRKVVGAGLGIGPLRTRLGEAFARGAARNLVHVIARDPETLGWLKNLHRPGVKVEMAPDLAVFLKSASRDETIDYLRRVEGVRLAEDELVVGIALRRWFHLKKGQLIPYEWHARIRSCPLDENTTLEHLIENMSRALIKFSEGRKIRLLFFPMAQKKWEGDSALASRLASKTGLPSHVLALRTEASTVKAIAGLCDLFVSIRMHSAIFAMSNGVPTAGIVHVRKTAHFYTMLGQEERIVSIGDASAPGGDIALVDLLQRLYEERAAISSELCSRTESLSSRVDVYRNALREWLPRGNRREVFVRTGRLQVRGQRVQQVSGADDRHRGDGKKGEDQVQAHGPAQHDSLGEA